MKKKHFLFVFITFTQSLFSVIGSETVSSPVAFDEFSSQNLESRQLIILIESGTSENIAESLYLGTPFRDTITDNLAEALKEDPKVPILVSENIVKNFALYHKLCDDFLHKTKAELYDKYGHLEKFKNRKIFDAFIESTRFLEEHYTKLSSLTQEYSKNPGKKSKKAILDFIEQFYTDKDNKFNDYHSVYLEARSLFFCYNAYNPRAWIAGKTAEGDFLFLPKNNNGKIAECGLHYQEIEGFDTPHIINPLEMATLDITKIYSQEMAHPERIIKSFKKLTKNKATTNNPPIDIYLTGHGSPRTPLIEKIENIKKQIDFYQKKKPDEKTDKDIITGKLLLLEEELDVFKKIQSQNFSFIGGLLDKDFSNDLVPTLQQAGTRTFTYETCFGGDLNTLQGWHNDDNDTMGIHTFTIVNGTLSITPLYTLRHLYINQLENLIKNNKKLEQGQTLPKLTTKNFGKYLKKISIDMRTAIKDFFDNPEGFKDIEHITNLPLIKLATTDYWMPFSQLSNNIMQISNVASETNLINKTPIIYNKKDNGVILLATTTLLAQLNIQTLPHHLPHLIPLSIGPKLHYIDTLILPENTSVTDFFTQSLQPFYEELLYVPDEIQKTLIIDNIVTGKKIYQAMIYGGYALYIEKTAPLIVSKKDSGILNIPLKVFSLDGSQIPTDLKPAKNFFQKKVAEAHRQASAERARLGQKTAAWQTSIATIKRRQSLLKILNTITTKKKSATFDWAAMAQKSEKEIITHILEEVSKEALEETLLLELSEYELQLLESIKKKK